METIDLFANENWDENNDNYYSFVDKIEVLDNGHHIIYFDSVLKSEISDNIDVNKINEESIKMIIADYTDQVFRGLLGILNIKGNEGFVETWINLVLTDERNEYPVLLYPEYYDPEINPQPITRFIHEITTKASEDETKKLKALFDIPKKSTPPLISLDRSAKLKHLLGKDEGMFPICDVNVFNIGQGNLNTIVDDKGNPFFYFDVGGGAYGNAFTYPSPNPRKLCFENNPLIILSHWDFDHWWTFNKLMRRNLLSPSGVKTKWLVPSQPTGVINNRFYDRLIKNGHQITIWEEDNNEILQLDPNVKVIKCNTPGKDKNNNGLVVIVTIGNQKILLPADASYENIPDLKCIKFSGLVASHHGGKITTEIANIPIVRENNGKIIYSCGAGNRYYHPSIRSIEKHKNKGWDICKVSFFGSASFIAHEPYDSPCEGDLGIEQVF